MSVEQSNEDAAQKIEQLHNLLCLADELLMEAIGAFPLPGNPMREPTILIRNVTGSDYHERKRRARLAVEGQKS